MSTEIIQGKGKPAPKKNCRSLTADDVQRLLRYDAKTGIFTWKAGAGPGKSSREREAGSIGARGRRTIFVRGRRYYAHRLAWLMTFGRWPENHIDHIDGNPLNNTILNLRECTDRENLQNMKLPSSNKSGFLGVSWKKDKKKWQAQIRIDGGVKFLGYFNCKEVAAARYETAKAIFHAFNPSVPARAKRSEP